MNEVTLKQAEQIVTESLKHHITPSLKSSPGIGKSALIHQIADKFKLKVIDIRLSQCDSTDLLGLPNFVKGRVSYCPLDIFPLEEDEIPEGYKGWLLFLDELGNASIDVMKASYKVIYDRMIGNSKLHENCFVVAASNREEDASFVNPLPSALKSRMLHINICGDVPTWLSYAVKVGIDSRIISFINWDNTQLFTDYVDSAEESYGCPRSWEAVSKFIKDKDNLNSDEIRASIAGLVGTPQQMKFYSLYKYF